VFLRKGGFAMPVRATVCLAVVLFAGGAAADELKSGPQKGEGILGGFGAQFVNGVHAGKKRCPV